MEEKIINLDAQIRDILDEINYLKQEIVKRDEKEHKSLSDYRVYEKLKDGGKYKTFDKYNEIMEEIWSSADLNIAQFKIGNVYSIETPNELLEREIKKRQLWFALEKYLKEHDCLVTNADWEDVGIIKYTVSYDIEHRCYDTCNCTSHKDNTIYSTCWEVLENYMDALSKEDIKIMFDIDID